MKIYKFKKNIDRFYYGKKGAEFVLADGYADDLEKEIESGDIEIRELEDWHTKYKAHDLNGKSILIFRFGGFGDLLFISSLVRYLKKKYPDSKICVACAKDKQMIWRRNKDIARFGIHNYPITWKLLQCFDYHLHLDGLIERNKFAEVYNVYDLVFNEAGFDFNRVDPRDKMPVYEPDPDHIKRARQFLKYQLNIDPKKERLIAIQARATSNVRTLDPRALMEVSMKFSMLKGFKVLQLGKLGDIPVNIINLNVFNLAGRLKMKESVAILKYCDLVITPDSAMVHFAAAMNIPTVSVFGPFPPDLRTRYYPLNMSVEPPPSDPEKCWPCFCHDTVCPKVVGKRIRTSPCLKIEKIPGELIFRAAIHQLERFEKPKIVVPDIYKPVNNRKLILIK